MSQTINTSNTAGPKKAKTKPRKPSAEAKAQAAASAKPASKEKKGAGKGASGADAWDRLSLRLRKQVGYASWNAWIKPVLAARAKKGVLVIDVSSMVAKDKINTKYADRLRVLGSEFFGEIRHVEIRVVKSKAPRLSQRRSRKPAEVKDEGRLLGSQLDPNLTFENFVVGPTNEMAEAVARGTAAATKVTSNPLFLYGGVGLGKTHLMHAIAWQIRESDPSRRVVYLTAEKFMNSFVDALRHKNVMTFKQQFRSVDVLMIDDLQFIGGKESTQDEFFHTFNALVEEKRQVVVSADKSPNDIDGTEERLRSRLGQGLVVDISPADYELRLGILRSKAELAGMSVPQDVLEFLARRINSNVRELEGALNRIKAHCDLRSQSITVEAATRLLSDLLQASSRKAITAEQIQQKVASFYRLRMTEMKSRRRSKDVTLARQMAMYMCKELTNLSFPKIGEEFGGRDHSTVMHAVKRIKQRQDQESQVAEDLQNLLNILSE